tara:strand:+ start:181 stop:330 length:150 start_codon:yes stop_codon:yes gene_type:complete
VELGISVAVFLAQAEIFSPQFKELKINLDFFVTFFGNEKSKGLVKSTND